MKPISFKPNDEMIRAILNGEKTVTRMAVKPQPEGAYAVYDMDMDLKSVEFACGNRGAGGVIGDYGVHVKAPYWFGDILYVRETWQYSWLAPDFCVAGENYIYRADWGERKRPLGGWKPYTHMPRKAARIFLRVTDVRVERLQDIDDDKALKEGCGIWGDVDWVAFPEEDFKRIWGNTIKPADRALYGWDSNPWVWVIEFERIEKAESFNV